MGFVYVGVLVFEVRPPDERTTEFILGIRKIRATSPLR